MRRSPVLGLLLGLALLAGACSGTKDPTAADLEAKVSGQLRASSTLTKAQADCYAHLLVDKIGASTINKLSITQKDPNPAVAKQLADAALSATRTCGIDPSAATTVAGAVTTSSTGATSTTAKGG
jgi:hypothetical protein